MSQHEPDSHIVFNPASRRAFLKAMAGTLALPWARNLPSAEPGQSKPNLLLVSMDTLRASHMGCFGYGLPTSPSMDALARNGILFSKAYSTSSWTAPAHASVFTGLYPPAHQIDVPYHEEKSPGSRLPEGFPTLARKLKGLGYATKAIISGPMVDRRFRFDQGFDDFDDRSYLKGADLSPASGDPVIREEILLYGVRAADAVQQAAEKWLKSNPPEPWFLFVHFWDIHADYKPPQSYVDRFDPEYRGPVDGTIKSEAVSPDMPKRDLEHLIARYDAGVAWTDGQFGRMMESLERLGLSGKTCVFLFSDHGEEFFEYGEKGHAHNLHDVLIHVPVIAAWPGVFAPQTHSQTPISLVDIPPTLIELAGGQAPEWMQGRSLAPVLLGHEESLPNVPLFGTLFFRNRSELFELQYPFKLINDSANATWQLYNLASDAGERCDLAGQFPALANIHFERLERWWAESLDARAAATKDI